MVCKCVPGSATQLLEHTSPELQRPWKRYLLQQQQQRRSQRHWYGRQYCTNQPLSQTSAQQPPHRPPLPTQHLRPQPVQRQPSHPPALPRIDLQNPSPAARPTFRFPVVVEGHNDRKAVQRALNAKVYVLEGSTRLFPSVLRDLRRLREQCGGLVILTDADAAGRQARNRLEAELPGCLHAFVPAPLATAGGDSRWHKTGNVGVEHAAPGVIACALRRARKGDLSRVAFTREQLVQLGLLAPHHLHKGGDFAARRAAVCAFLGLGACDGKQLLKQLNGYGFGEGDLREAMLWAREQLAQEAQRGRGPQDGEG